MTLSPDDTVNIENNNVFIKGRFKSSSLNLYGLFLLMFNSKGEINSYNVVVSTFSSIYDKEPHLGWDVFEETIIDHRWKGNCNTSMTTSLISQFENINNDPYQRSQLYKSINDYDYRGAEAFLFDSINRVIQDKNMVLETGIQEVSYEEIEAIKKRRDGKDADNTQGTSSSNSKIEEGAKILETSVVLAPVKGKPLYDLKIGDKIMQRIEPSTGQANYFIDLYNLRVENRIKPIPGEVIDIKAKSKNDPIEIITRIDDTVYGKSIEDERQVKVRLYDQRLDGEFQTFSKKKSTSNNITQVSTNNETSVGMYVMFIIFGILLLVLIGLIYILI